MTSPQRELSEFLNRSDGMSMDDALDRAALHLESMRGKIECGIDDNVAAIGALIQDKALDLRTQAHTLYSLADGILSVAAMFQRKTLGDIAFSLCDLLKVFENAAVWENGAIRAHYDAMRLVQTKPDLTFDERGELLRNLSDMVKLIALRNGVTQ
jgi:hypothetical protein